MKSQCQSTDSSIATIHHRGVFFLCGVDRGYFIIGPLLYDFSWIGDFDHHVDDTKIQYDIVLEGRSASVETDSNSVRSCLMKHEVSIYDREMDEF